LNLRSTKIQINIHFLCSKSTEKEVINHNFYDETAINEIYSIDSQNLIRFKCWFRLVRSTALLVEKPKLISQNYKSLACAE